MEKKKTTCRLCSAGRPIEVVLEDGRLVSAHAQPEAPGEYRYFCPKLNAARDIVYSSARLRSPLCKDTHRGRPYWKEVSWETALERMAERLHAVRKRYGAESLCWLMGHAPDYGSPWDYANRFMSVFGSPNVLGNGSLCHAARELAHVSTYGAMTSPDYKHASCIVVWGKNEADTNPAGYNMTLSARQRGARLIVIDPVKTKLASMADLWLQVKPGGDGLLAMSMIQVMIDEALYDQDFVRHWTRGFERLSREAARYTPENTAPPIWLKAEDIRRAARLYAQTRPAALIDGNGLDMHLEVAQTMRAICILRALSGNLDRPGGDLIPKRLPMRDIKLKERLPKDVQPISHGYPLFRRYHQARGDHALGCFVDAVLEENPYPVKALVVQGMNPAVSLPNAGRVREALEKIEFVVVMDPIKTRTAQLADLVLPATTSFETTGLNLKGLSSHHVMLQDRVIDWVHDAWPDWKIVFELAKVMGFEKEFPWNTVEEAIDYQLEPTGITVEKLRSRPEGITYEELRYEKYKEGGFSTPSRKVELVSERWEDHSYAPVPHFPPGAENRISFFEERDAFPFIGMSGARSRCYVHSQLRHVPRLLDREPEPLVDIHPFDAEGLGVSDGEWVRVESPVGWARMKARIWNGVPKGTLRIAWGWGEWSPESNINNLTDDSEHNPVTSTTSNRCFFCRLVRDPGQD